MNYSIVHNSLGYFHRVELFACEASCPIESNRQFRSMFKTSINFGHEFQKKTYSNLRAQNLVEFLSRDYQATN